MLKSVYLLWHCTNVVNYSLDTSRRVDLPYHQILAICRNWFYLPKTFITCKGKLAILSAQQATVTRDSLHFQSLSSPFRLFVDCFRCHFGLCPLYTIFYIMHFLSHLLISLPLKTFVDRTQEDQN